jgi:hypothetical protein
LAWRVTAELFELSSPGDPYGRLHVALKEQWQVLRPAGLESMLRQILVKRKKFLVSPERTRP